MPDRHTGLYAKYYVARMDGRDAPGGDKDNARYFVLDYVNDPGAVVALRAYIHWAEDNGYDSLALDLRYQLEAVAREA